MTKEQFSQIYDQYSKEIFSFFNLRLQSSDSAKDLLSESFWRFWKTNSEKPMDYIKNPRAFLYKLSRNILIDHYRSNSKESLIVSLEGSLVEDENNLNIPQFESKENIQKDFEVSEKKKQILKIIKDLNPLYADVLIFYYIEGLTSTEISQIINKTESNTRVLIHRALESLKKAMI